MQKTLGNPEHIGVVKRGLAAIRNWREAHPRASLDLRGANFQGIKLTGADLSGAKFGAALPDERPATLRNARLRNAQLQGSYLRMVDLGENLDAARGQCAGELPKRLGEAPGAADLDQSWRHVFASSMAGRSPGDPSPHHWTR